MRFWLTVLLTLTANAAHAQLDPDVFPIDMVSPVLKELMLENVLDDAGARGSSPPITVTATTYRASPDVSARVKERYVDFIRTSVSAQAAQQYEEVLKRNDPVRNWTTLVAEEGLRPGDVADALA